MGPFERLLYLDVISRSHADFAKRVIRRLEPKVKVRVECLSKYEREDDALTYDGRLKDEEPWKEFLRRLERESSDTVVATALNVPPDVPDTSPDPTVVVGVNTGDHPKTLEAAKLADVIVVGRRLYSPDTGPREFDRVRSGKFRDGTVIVDVEDLGLRYASEAVPLIAVLVAESGVEGLVRDLKRDRVRTIVEDALRGLSLSRL
ncbi:hypothetical protein [Methanopyrus sp.]